VNLGHVPPPSDVDPGPAAVHRVDLEVVVHRIRRGPVATGPGALTLEGWMT
jgi:hypothetical protein